MKTTNDGPPAIEIINVFKKFGEAENTLSGVNIRVPAGKITFLLGPSGTGKSVLLKHIVGLLNPDRGEVRIMGEELPRQNFGRNLEKMNHLRKHLGVLFQGSALFDTMNVYQNVAFPLSEATLRLKKREIQPVVYEALRTVGFDPPRVIHKFPNQLSGGMQKRVALARAIIRTPKIILYDEPTTGLDPPNRMMVEEMIIDMNESLQLTNFVITHDIESAFAFAHFIGFLYAGKIVFWGTPYEFSRSDHPVIRKFLYSERTVRKKLEEGP